ncbi:hypothetical protein D1823_21750 (plasmid) [Ruegeria sp. AD91A]|uniref:DoxX family protein n=1 Tax=Ruegeria sp. AD91A TaxID=2293862 RepID=UPI000E47136F|nr:hypothetical protein [Ruegeria sp. AD91A]AXT29296.1 hypothetical protein D1823_21750 [Ruegeria sp. AD91A]
MTTPLIILCLLFIPLLVARAIGGTGKTRLGGTIGIALAFAFFGVGHFFETKAMTRMIPPFIPFATPLVLATGLLELGVAAGLINPANRRLAGLLGIGVLVAFFPVNVYAAFNHTGMGGHVQGPIYLLIRAPLQSLLIWWAWFFVVHPGDAVQSNSLGMMQIFRKGH